MAAKKTSKEPISQGAPMALQNNMKVPKSSLQINDAATVKLSEDEESGVRKASLTAYSGNVIKNHWLWGDLAIDVSGIQFKKKRYPILEEHDITRKVGFSNTLPVTENNALEFSEIHLLNNKVAQEFYDNSKAGFPYQASVHIKPTVIEEIGEEETAEVNGFKMKGPGTIFRKSVYRETSVCVHGYDDNTEAQALSDNDDKIELSIDIVGGKNVDSDQQSTDNQNSGNQDNGGSIMDLKKLKEDYPQLVTELTEEIGKAFKQEIDQKDTEINKLKQQNTELSGNNETLGNRIKALEDENLLRKENELKASVNSIVADKLNKSNIPQRLHDRFTDRFSYNQYVDDKNAIDMEKLRTDIDGEIKHWETSLSEVSGSNSTVRGFSTSQNTVTPPTPGEQFSENDAESITQRILGHIGVKTENA